MLAPETEKTITLNPRVKTNGSRRKSYLLGGEGEDSERRLHALVSQAWELRGTPYLVDACSAVEDEWHRRHLTRLERNAELIALLRETARACGPCARPGRDRPGRDRSRRRPRASPGLSRPHSTARAPTQPGRSYPLSRPYPCGLPFRYSQPEPGAVVAADPVATPPGLAGSADKTQRGKTEVAAAIHTSSVSRNSATSSAFRSSRVRWRRRHSSSTAKQASTR